MMPYRLEMGTRLENERGKNLYEFWGGMITDGINKQLKAQKLSADEIVKKTFDLLEIDELGLGKPDRAVLEAIILKFNGGPVGLNTIAAATGEEPSTIEDVIEPYLIRHGLLERTPRGRTASPEAYSHISVD